LPSRGSRRARARKNSNVLPTASFLRANWWSIGAL
jgi:hypothetical protein